WLMKWIKSARLSQVKKSSAALRALHKDSYDGYRTLLGEGPFGKLIRISGLMQIWETETFSTADRLADSLRDAEGIKYEHVSGKKLFEMFPGLSTSVKRGLLLPRNGFTINPAKLVAQLAEIFQREGGEIKIERVMKVLPQEHGIVLMTNRSNQVASRVVVAAGGFLV